MQHGTIVMQEAHRVCRKLHYLTMTDDERFLSSFKRLCFMFWRF